VLALTLKIDETIKQVRPDDWRGIQAKEQIIKAALYGILQDEPGLGASSSSSRSIRNTDDHKDQAGRYCRGCRAEGHQEHPPEYLSPTGRAARLRAAADKY